MVRGSTLVAKVEEALQHRTRTIDFTLSAINGHARVPRGSHDAARPHVRSAAVAVLRTYYIKGGTPNTFRTTTKATVLGTMKKSDMSPDLAVGQRMTPAIETASACADRGPSSHLITQRR